jgi:hypothetical protein
MLIIFFRWAIGTATGYRSDGRRVRLRVPVGEIFLISTSSRPALGSTQPPIQWVSAALPPGVKRPECEAENSPPTSTEIKNRWVYTSTPHTNHLRELTKY